MRDASKMMAPSVVRSMVSWMTLGTVSMGVVMVASRLRGIFLNFD